METSIRPEEKNTPEYCSDQACICCRGRAHLSEKTRGQIHIYLCVYV